MATSQPPNTGGNMKFYRNTASAASPTWALIAEIGDLSISEFTRTFAELKRRSSSFTLGLPALFQMISVEFKLWHGLDSTTYDALRTAFLAGTITEYAIMDTLVATSGAQGLRCPFGIEQFPWDQSLEEVSGHDVVLKAAYWESPAGTAINPSWLVTP